MALNLAADLAIARQVALINQALFGIALSTPGGSSTAFVELQIARIKANGAAGEAQTLINFALASKSKADVFIDICKNLFGFTPTASQVSAALNAFSGVSTAAMVTAYVNYAIATQPALVAQVDQLLSDAQSGSGSPFNVPAAQTPTDIKIDGGASDSVAENSPAGTVVGVLTAVDGNAGETFTFKLLKIDGVAVTGDIGEAFKLDGNKLVVQDASDLDFETKTSHTVEIQVTDSTGRTFTKTLTINVTDVNESVIIPLTLGVDVVDGSQQDDIFVTNGVASLLGGDTLNGLGGRDTLDIRAVLGGLVSGTKTTGIEVVQAQLSNDLINPLVINMNNMSGVEELRVVSSEGDVRFEQINADFVSGPAQVLVQDSQGDLTLAFKNPPGPNTNDTINLTLNNAGPFIDVTMTGRSIETLNIETTGAPSSIDDLRVQGMTTLNISGDEAIQIGDTYGDDLKGNNPALTQVNASGLDADITVFLMENAGDNVGYQGGSGNDTVFIGDGLNGQTRNLTGGAGTDALVMFDDNSVPDGGDLNVISGFEIARFTNTVNQDIDAQNLDGIRRYEFDGDVDTVTIRQLTANDAAGYVFAFANVGANAISDVTLDVGLNDTVALPERGNGTNDKVRFEISDVDLALTVRSNEIEQLTYAKLGNGNNTLTLANENILTNQVWEDLTTLIIEGPGTGVLRVGDDGGDDTPFLTLINGSAAAAAIDMRGANGVAGDGDDLGVAATGATIIGGGGNDFLIGSATGQNTLTGNGGNDTLLGGNLDDLISGGSGNDVLNGDSGDDVLNGGSGADTMDGDLGADRFVIDSGGVGDLITAAGIDVITNVDNTTGAVLGGQDFVTGQDTIDFANFAVAGSAANFIDVTGPGVVTYLDAIGAANTAFALNSNLVYAKAELTINALGVSDFVFADTNGDRIVDQVVQVVGGGANVAATDIIAGL